LFQDNLKSLIENAIGGDGADTIVGNVGGNWLDGGGGKDTVTGGDGKDSLLGGSGGDNLRGGKGSDAFLFGNLTDSAGSDTDIILDLKNTDVIDLSEIDAKAGVGGDQAFTLVGALTGHKGEAALFFDGGLNKTVLELDTNGDGVADATLYIKGDHHDFTNFVL
ncbi:MAG: M10 family metallopeptidase C-terminal domain-containing protein, partial [Caulobacteraceae bacterium]